VYRVLSRRDGWNVWLLYHWVRESWKVGRRTLMVLSMLSLIVDLLIFPMVNWQRYWAYVGHVA
jgi:hypothetical protein